MAVLTWMLAASLLAFSFASESILDMIDTREVERIIAERKSNSSREYFLEHNSLNVDDGEDYTEPSIRRNISEEMQLQGLLRRQGDKLLRSSKDALLITRKEYLRKDWCKTEPLVQVVQEEGCSPVTILNKFCYGQCNSFYIPKGTKRKGKIGKAGHDQSAFKSCAFCKPKQSSWITITLRCRKKNKAALRRKKVLRIKQCKCIAQVLN